MKKIALLALAIIGLSAMAATCVFKNVRVSEFNGKAVLSAEIENQTDADILNHKIKVAFLDNDLDVIDTRTVEGCLRSLQSGESNFFTAKSDEDFDDVEVTLQRLEGPFTFGQVADDGGLDIKDVKVTYSDNEIVVFANIKNNGNDDLEDVRLCAVIVDDDDKIIIVGRSNAQDIDEDQTKGFTVTMDAPDDTGDINHADLFADATNPSENDKPTKPVSEVDQDADECPNPTNTPTTPVPTNTPVPPTATPGAGTPTVAPFTATSTSVPDAC